MSSPKKGWKIIAHVNKNKQSATVELKDGGVRYYFSKWTTPKKGCGPLCVFNSYEDALNFSLDVKEIYPCLYNPSKRKEKKVWCKFDTDSDFPEGTVLATRVKLLKEVK